MLRQLVAILKTRSLQARHRNMGWLIVGLFALIVTLDFSTPPSYAYGFLYIGPILLANTRFSRFATLQVTLAAVGLTVLGVFFPSNVESIHPLAIVNRLGTVTALVIAGWLHDRVVRYEEAIARQKLRLQAQEQLALMREDFVSTLTHDLKTPLLGAIETLKLWQQGNFGIVTAAQQEVLEIMARSHRNSLQLVETLLDAYRNDAEGLKLKLAPVDLVALAEETIATLANLASARRVNISLSYGESDSRPSLWGNGDVQQLRRVFSNLLTNAINHSPRGGKVEVVLEAHATAQVVKILDNGWGMAEDELPHLFERFYQGHSERQVMGSGLGLYLTRQIIEAHHGIIWAENRFPSRNTPRTPCGALFGFQLPAYLPAAGQR